MYDTFYDHKPGPTFSTDDGHYFVDVQQDQADTPLRFQTGTLHHVEVADWVSRQSVSQQKVTSCRRFRVLILKPRMRTPPADFMPFTVSQDTFHLILRHFAIPKATINFVNANPYLAVDFDGSEDEAELSDPQASSEVRGIFCVIRQQSLLMSYNQQSKVINVLVLGLYGWQTSKFLKSLRLTRNLLDAPLLVAVAWLHVLAERIGNRMLIGRNDVRQTHLGLGIHFSQTGKTKPLQEIDFQGLTRTLSTHGSETALDMTDIEALLDTCPMIEALQDHVQTSVWGSEAGTIAVREVEAQLQNLKRKLTGFRRWMDVNKARNDLQLQALFGFVSQRDNENSYATAVSSQHIAEAAQRDGVVMKQLAEDSRAVSIRAWTDGVDMRIMAAVTLLTLPGTFAATLFSTTFFNFQPGGGDRVVSPWVWLYVAVTAGLTFLIVAAWYLSSKAMTRKVQDIVSGSKNDSIEHIELGGSRLPSSANDNSKKNV